MIFWLLIAVVPCHAGSSTGIDVRVLIDISGSMRENDPQNLRRPALRMLVGLLQPGTQAGVWTFARWANMLVPHGEVNEAWKKKALALSRKIGSPGQFTNIEEVLRRATDSRRGQTDVVERHLVLLTDGVVDVSKEPGASATSRDRIIKQLLPAIKSSGATIHALALSDRADHELLKQLANGTDGWYQKVETADELQRVFLRIFEKLGKPDGVPLKGNRFQVDKSIREATVLVFRANDASPTRLHAPDGSSFEASDISAGIAWQTDQGYDLITIADPQVGEWRLEAEEDPDNRVMIVTDLKLETPELPNRLVMGEGVPFTAQLTNKGQLISRRAFLRLVDVTAEASSVAGQRRLPINDQGKGADQQVADGQFSMRLEALAPAGPMAVVVAAESSTFVREKRFLVDVVTPGELAISTDNPIGEARLSVDAELLPEVAAVRMWQLESDDSPLELQVAARTEGGWAAPLLNPALPVMASLEGRTRSANRLVTELGPVYAPGVTAPASAAPAPLAVEPALIEAPVEPAPPPNGATTDDPEWMLPAAWFGGVNLLLLVGGLSWWFLKRRGGDNEEFDLIDDEPSGSNGPRDKLTENSRAEAA